MLTLIKPNTETDTELAWRKALKPGDEIAVEYHEKYGTCYLPHEVQTVDNGYILCDVAWFSTETGCSDNGVKGSHRIVRPTPEIRERIDTAQRLDNLMHSQTCEVFDYLPLPMLQQIAAITGIAPHGATNQMNQQISGNTPEPIAPRSLIQSDFWRAHFASSMREGPLFSEHIEGALSDYVAARTASEQMSRVYDRLADIVRSKGVHDSRSLPPEVKEALNATIGVDEITTSALSNGIELFAIECMVEALQLAGITDTGTIKQLCRRVILGDPAEDDTADAEALAA